MSTWKTGDLEPDLAGTFTDNGVATSLATAVTVPRVHVKRPDGTVIDRAVTLGNQTTNPGTWSMAWVALDLSGAGTYEVELEIAWETGRTQTTPTVSFYVAAQIA